MVILVVVSIISYIVLRKLRRSHSDPKYVPTQFLKQKWRAWQPQAQYIGLGRNSARDSRSINTEYNPGAGQDESASANAAAAGVDRNTSVRSVMTLPAYSSAPKETEQVIGREGERGGMDTVVEYPESAEIEENRREEQMESLYQIRLARRQEIAEREQRRQERREARSRGDFARLEQLRIESQQRAQALTNLPAATESHPNLTSQIMMAEHQSRGRERRVSAVSYADVGQVRHDGTRLRGNSQDSDNRPLLDSAASMGAGESAPRPSMGSSLYEPPRPSFHRRGGSASSVLSVSTTASEFDAPQQTTPPSTSYPSHQHSSGSDPATSPDATRDTPPDSDIGDSQIPPPPSYEHAAWGDAPAYSSPIVDRGEGPNLHRQQSTGPPQLPQLQTLPSISVETATGPNTPATPVRR